MSEGSGDKNGEWRATLKRRIRELERQLKEIETRYKREGTSAVRTRLMNEADNLEAARRELAGLPPKPRAPIVIPKNDPKVVVLVTPLIECRRTIPPEGERTVNRALTKSFKKVRKLRQQIGLDTKSFLLLPDLLVYQLILRKKVQLAAADQLL